MEGSRDEQKEKIMTRWNGSVKREGLEPVVMRRIEERTHGMDGVEWRKLMRKPCA